MGEIKIKYIAPKSTELDVDDIIINVTTGDIFYKDIQGRLNTLLNIRPPNPPSGGATTAATSSTSMGGSTITGVTGITATGTITSTGDKTYNS